MIFYKNICLITGLFCFMSLQTYAAPNEHDADEIRVICNQLLSDYAIYRDHLDEKGFVSIFTKGAELKLGTGTYKGIDQIRKNITDRQSPSIAHMVLLTTSQITPLSAKKAQGLSYAIVLNGNRAVGFGDKPIEMEGLTSAVEYQTEFQKTIVGWKIARLELKPIFRGPGYLR